MRQIGFNGFLAHRNFAQVDGVIGKTLQIGSTR
jgi:hypothetical protein